MTHHTDAERAEFETWFILRARQKTTSVLSEYTDDEIRDAFMRRTPEESGTYVNARIRIAWEAWQAARRAPAVAVPQVSIEKLEDWKRRVNTLATCGLKADRYRVGSALKQDIAEAIAAAPQPPEAAPVRKPLTEPINHAAHRPTWDGKSWAMTQIVPMHSIKVDQLKSHWMTHSDFSDDQFTAGVRYAERAHGIGGPA